MQLAWRVCRDRQHAVREPGVVGEALAEDAVEQLVEQPQPAGEVDVEQFLSDPRPMVLDAVAMSVDHGGDDRLRLVEDALAAS